jgi:hypothetical protein
VSGEHQRSAARAAAIEASADLVCCSASFGSPTIDLGSLPLAGSVSHFNRGYIRHSTQRDGRMISEAPCGTAGEAATAPRVGVRRPEGSSVASPSLMGTLDAAEAASGCSR